MSLDRRAFLTACSGLAAGLIAPAAPAFAAPGQAARFHQVLAQRGINSRALWLTRPQSGEEARFVYANGNIVLREGYMRACQLLRDVRANKVSPIDPRLLDILGVIQTWTRLNGINRPITILSGYRSHETNKRLEGAAKNSMHLYGKAADIRIKGIPNEMLAKLIGWLSEGGVGVYRESNFIHVDTGRVRSWSG